MAADLLAEADGARRLEARNRLSRELAVPVIDARDWVDERLFADGFHLSRAGAAAFTARLGPVIATTFPPAGGKP